MVFLEFRQGEQFTGRFISIGLEAFYSRGLPFKQLYHGKSLPKFIDSSVTRSQELDFLTHTESSAFLELSKLADKPRVLLSKPHILTLEQRKWSLLGRKPPASIGERAQTASIGERAQTASSGEGAPIEAFANALFPLRHIPRLAA